MTWNLVNHREQLYFYFNKQMLIRLNLLYLAKQLCMNLFHFSNKMLIIIIIIIIMVTE
jgi:hypothetical protein